MNKITLKKLTSTKYLTCYSLILITIVSIFYCIIDSDDVVTYLWQRNYSGIKIENSVGLIIPFEADSGTHAEVRVKGNMINLFGNNFIINKTRTVK